MTSPQEILTRNILPYWMALRDPIQGGFYAQVRGDETVVQDAPRGVILYARIMWAFSAAYRVLQVPEYLESAQTAKAYIEAHMLHTNLSIAEQAYLLYAYAEYGRATSQSEIPLTLPLPITDSAELNMHIMEAYSNLYRLSPLPEHKQRLQDLVNFFCQLTTVPTELNAGHCIECVWLLDEAAALVGMNADTTIHMLAKAADEGINSDGTLDDREWWKQAEAVIGYDHLYHRFGDKTAQQKARRFLKIIRTRYIDYEHGEWFWLLRPDGTPDLSKDKVSLWKCPYHNTRLCLYLIATKAIR